MIEFKVGDRVKCLCQSPSCRSKTYVLDDVDGFNLHGTAEDGNSTGWSEWDLKEGMVILESVYNSPLWQALK